MQLGALTVEIDKLCSGSGLAPSDIAAVLATLAIGYAHDAEHARRMEIEAGYAPAPEQQEGNIMDNTLDKRRDRRASDRAK